MATTRDYYDILGVPRGASDAEVKRAFRKLAQQWHPDVNTEPGADERFKQISEAYRVLSDPQQRQAYDLFGRAGVSQGAAGADSFTGFGAFGDLFDAFFGGAATAGARRTRTPAGADLRYDLTLTFAESISGTEKEIEFTALAACETCGGSGAEPGTSVQTCPRCGGSGEISHVRQTMLGQMINVTACDRCRGAGRIIDMPCGVCRGEGRLERKRGMRVVVPAGIDEGHQIRLSGEGEAAPRGGVAGNLYVVVHIRPHPQLRRQDTELFYELPLTITQAALGARLTVPTATASEEIEIKPGTQPGSEIRLRGRGVPHLRRPGVRGDLHVLVDVRVPTRLSVRERELLEQLAAEWGEGERPISD
ncbi:MAG: molecular chaperone DnaJ, partial [Chloroflexota bacterium]|nr:molecular chaperone DnaJ [Chloroflexota bacterium]